MPLTDQQTALLKFFLQYYLPVADYRDNPDIQRLLDQGLIEWVLDVPGQLGQMYYTLTEKGVEVLALL